MRNIDIQRSGITACLISPDDILQAKIKADINNLGSTNPINVSVVSEFGDASSINADAVLIDMLRLEASALDAISWLDRVRTLRPHIVCIALWSEDGNANPGNLIQDCGFDLVFSREQTKLMTANLLGSIRYAHAVANARRLHSVRVTEPSGQIGDWVLMPRLRAVKRPDQIITRLTEVEWSYLEYLVGRDVNGVDLPESVREKFERNQRQNAIVYKIKKKLGEGFPIVTIGNGQYGILRPDGESVGAKIRIG
jgi:hypothetical protein